MESRRVPHSMESQYRQALSASVIAKAEYLALLDQGGATPASLRQARQNWQSLDERKRAVAARLGELENSQQHLNFEWREDPPFGAPQTGKKFLEPVCRANPL